MSFMAGQTKSLRFATKIAPLIGFIGTVAGMAFIFAAIERSETFTPHDLMRGVGVGLIITLILIILIFGPLVAWVHFSGHSD